MNRTVTKRLREEACIYIIEHRIQNAVNFWREYKRAYNRDKW